MYKRWGTKPKPSIKQGRKKR